MPSNYKSNVKFNVINRILPSISIFWSCLPPSYSRKMIRIPETSPRSILSKYFKLLIDFVLAPPNFHQHFQWSNCNWINEPFWFFLKCCRLSSVFPDDYTELNRIPKSIFPLWNARYSLLSSKFQYYLPAHPPLCISRKTRVWNIK